MKKILSIDGGGISGIIPGQVLVALEKKIQVKTNDPEARLADFFDFFSGTSTGGILTCICLCPTPLNPQKVKFLAKQAVDLYVKHGNEIYDVKLWQKIKSAGGIIDEKYRAAALEFLLTQYFGNLKLSELLKPCLIPAYDIKRREALFFAQQDYEKNGSEKNFLVRDVCRATSAAPTFLETALVRSQTNKTFSLIDGGVFANNPSLCAYSEVRNVVNNPTVEDMFLVSLGTGSRHNS